MQPQYKQQSQITPLNLEKSSENERLRYLADKVVQMQKSIDYLERERNRIRHELDAIKARLNGNH